MCVFPAFIHFLNTLTPAVGFLTGYLHHRVHVVWQPKAISEENKEKSQDHECEGQPLALFTSVYPGGGPWYCSPLTAEIHAPHRIVHRVT